MATEPTHDGQRSASDGVPPPAVDDPPGFAPEAPTDGRELGKWESRFNERSARIQIAVESFYVWCLLAVLPVIMLAVELRNWPIGKILKGEQLDRLTPISRAYIGGMFGGGLFATKWLYHTVAKGTWNADRLLWRLFTPLLSGGVSVTVVLLCAGRVLPLFGSDLVRTSTGALGVAILVGYFSDKTFSKLERLAEQHLGEKRPKAEL